MLAFEFAPLFEFDAHPPVRVRRAFPRSSWTHVPRSTCSRHFPRAMMTVVVDAIGGGCNNQQAICDVEARFLSVHTGSCGSTHDSIGFQTSSLGSTLLEIAPGGLFVNGAFCPCHWVQSVSTRCRHASVCPMQHTHTHMKRIYRCRVLAAHCRQAGGIVR